MSLSEKSDAEIRELLTEYGIKHGPVVDSTRQLYEKKLEQAMEEAAQNCSSDNDKTYYREEEVVTYITYNSPPRSEVTRDVGLRHRGAAEPIEQQDQEAEEEEEEEEEEVELDKEPLIQSAVPNTVHSSAPSKPAAKQSKAGCLWSMVRVLLLLALLAALYYLLCHVMSSEEEQQREQ